MGNLRLVPNSNPCIFHGNMYTGCNCENKRLFLLGTNGVLRCNVHVADANNSFCEQVFQVSLFDHQQLLNPVIKRMQHPDSSAEQHHLKVCEDICHSGLPWLHVEDHHSCVSSYDPETKQQCCSREPAVSKTWWMCVRSRAQLRTWWWWFTWTFARL